MKIHPTGAFPTRSRNKTQRNAVEEHAGGNTGGAEKAFHPTLGRHFRSSGTLGRLVEVLFLAKDLDEQLPRHLTRLGITLAHGEIRAQCLTVVREMNFKLRRDWRLLRTRVSLGRETPAEDGCSECVEVLEAVFATTSRGFLTLVDPAVEQCLPFHVVPIEDGPCLDQGGSRDHKAVRLDEAEPFEMGTGVWVRPYHPSTAPTTSTKPTSIQQVLVVAREPLTLPGLEYLTCRVNDYFSILEVLR